MAKRSVGAFRWSRNDVTDLHLLVAYDHPIDEQFHQPALLLEGALASPALTCSQNSSIESAIPASSVRSLAEASSCRSWARRASVRPSSSLRLRSNSASSNTPPR